MKTKKVLFTSFLTSALCGILLFGKTNKVFDLRIGNAEALTSTECKMQLGETVIVCIGDQKNTCHERYNNIDVYCDGIKVIPDNVK